MPIPDRLRFPPVDPQLYEEMAELCNAIEEELETGGTAEDLLQRWHSHTSRRYQPSDFENYWSGVSQETFILSALNPVAELDPQVTYAEAAAVLDAVMKAELQEHDSNSYLDWLETQFPGGNLNDLIYWPDEWFGNASLFRNADGAFKPGSELSCAQILGYAMAKSGRRLPGAPEDIVLPFPMPGAT